MARSASSSGRSEFTQDASKILGELGTAAYGGARFVEAHILPAGRKHQEDWRRFILSTYNGTMWLSDCLDGDSADNSENDKKLECAARRGMHGLPMSKECEVPFGQDIGDRERV